MPVKVAIESSHELVEVGLRTVLASLASRVVVVHPNEVVSVDVVLWSALGTPRPADLSDLRSKHRATYLAVLCWNFAPKPVASMLAAGASGYLSTQLSGDELVDALERIEQGEVVVAGPASDPERSVEEVVNEGAGLPDWPGKSEGLSERESDIVALIGCGLSNDEISRQLFLSINTVKSYIRSEYQKMGVSTRALGVLWAVDHGMRQ